VTRSFATQETTMLRTMLFVIAVAAVLAGAGPAHAVPQVLQYQGRLTDAAGEALAGPTDVTFAIYTQAEGGTPLWTQRFDALVLDNGRFSVLLGGALAPFTPELGTALRAGTALHLGIQVAGDPEMTPRQPIASVVYALHAGSADMAIGNHARSADTATYARRAGHAKTADMAIGDHARSADTASYARTSGTAATAATAGRAQRADQADDADHADLAERARNSDRAALADLSTRAAKADTATYARHAGQSAKADSALHARTATHAATADVALTSHAATADTAVHARTADRARVADVALSQQVVADTALYAYRGDRAREADSVVTAPGIAYRSLYRGPTYPGQVTSLVSATITTPGPGYILVLGTGSLALDNELGGGVRCYVNVAEDSSATQSTMGRIQLEVAAGADSVEHFFPFTCQRVYAKPAGRYTFYLNIRNFSTTGKVTNHRPTISAVYIPNAYGTTDPEGIDPAAALAPREQQLHVDR
jgi:hypothetical protein